MRQKLTYEVPCYMGNISIKNWLEDNKSEMCYTYLGHRVKYGDHFLDHFLDYVFGPFFWTIL